MKKPKLDYGNGYNETNSIALIWSIEDVKSLKGSFDHRDVDLTDEDCMEILGNILKHYDTSEGVSWSDICYEVDVYLETSGKWVDK
jgi:hypothetical protein